MRKKSISFRSFVFDALMLSVLSVFVFNGCHKSQAVTSDDPQPNPNPPVPPDIDIAFRGVGNQNSLKFTFSPLAIAELERLSTTEDSITVNCSESPNSITYVCNFDNSDSMWSCDGTILLSDDSTSNYFLAPAQRVSTPPPNAILFDNDSVWCPENISVVIPMSINSVPVEGGYCSITLISEGC